METTRQNKIARLLQKELSEIFLLQTKAMPGVLVSVSAVRISPDMSIARVYLSVFPSDKSEEMVKNINNNMKSIRFELGTRVRHQLRIIPELKFFVDDSLDYIEKIDALLKCLPVSDEPHSASQYHRASCHGKTCKIPPDDSERMYDSGSSPVENHISDDTVRPGNGNPESHSPSIHLLLQKTQCCHADRSVPAVSRFFHP